MKIPLKYLSIGLVCALASSAFGAVDLWVSTEGNDKNPGTKEAPLASPAMAWRKARDIRRTGKAPEGGIRILLQGGTYFLEETLLVRSEDSGIKGSPTSMEAAEGERVVLSGGRRLGGWERVSGSALRFPVAAQGKLWSAPVGEWQGLPLEFRQLWVGEGKAVRARHPNGNEMFRLGGWNAPGKEALVQSEALKGLSSGEGVEMVVQQQWEIGVLRLASLAKEASSEKREAGSGAVAPEGKPVAEPVKGPFTALKFKEPEATIEFSHPWPQPILPPMGGGAYYLVNAPEFLDQPGEWWLDRREGRVYYWPKEGEDMSKAEVIVPLLERLVEVCGPLDTQVAHLKFKGIEFSNTTWLRPSRQGHVPLQAGMYLRDAYSIDPKGNGDSPTLDNQAWIGRAPAGVVVRGARNVRFEGCRFEHMAMSGLDLMWGTRDVIVDNCEFRDLGGNGIQAGSFQEDTVETHIPYDPSDVKEVCTRDRITNNLITDIGNEDWGCVGILAGYVREIAIEHNEVTNVPYTAISLGWGWTGTPNAMRQNVVKGNLLHKIATRMCDTAGVYVLSCQPGTVVSENVVKDIKMSPYVDRPDHWFYLYTDEGTSYVTVKDNWTEAEKYLQNANGPGNTWEHNGRGVGEEIVKRAGRKIKK